MKTRAIIQKPLTEGILTDKLFRAGWKFDQGWVGTFGLRGWARYYKYPEKTSFEKGQFCCQIEWGTKGDEFWTVAKFHLG